MNRTIPRIGAMVVTITVFLFAICLILDVPFVSYLVYVFIFGLHYDGSGVSI